MKRILTSLAIGAITLASFSSCQKEGTTNPDTNKGSRATVRLHLTDAPAKYEAVYIDIQQIEVSVEGSAAVTLEPARKGVYDLLKFRNGMDTLLVEAGIPAGRVNQIRLILGTNNSVVVDGEIHSLNTPSAQTSGLKLNLKENLVAGAAYDLWLDFDAGSSIVATGSGKYNLKPVIRAYSSLTNGRIKGYVLPAAAMVTVYASNGTETYAAIPNSSGYFMFSGLPEGEYTVTYDADALLYIDLVLKNINVSFGVETDLGTRVIAL